MSYTKHDYEKAIEFALNYPPEIGPYYYSTDKDLYSMCVLVDGWYNINLQGSFVRSCLKWKGIKKWERIS